MNLHEPAMTFSRTAATIAAEVLQEAHLPSESYFVHHLALVETGAIGAGTRIWAWAHVLPGATIGADVNLCDHTFVENDVVIGDRVTVKCGVSLWDGTRIEDDVFIGPGVAFANDRFPRSKQPFRRHITTIRRGASIGAGAVILPGMTIGERAMVGAGAVVTREVPAGAVVVGNPARVVRTIEDEQPSRRTSVDDCRIVELPRIADPRGNLSFIEAGEHVPFEIKRVYYIYDVPGGESRGGHAHKRLEQLLVAMSGAFDVVVDDGERRRIINLNRSYYGLYIPTMVWRELVNFSSGSVCTVMASEHYEEDDYYRIYDEFVSAKRGRTREAAA